MFKTENFIFATHFLSRLIFVLFLGFYNNYALQPDSVWLVAFGDRVLEGDFNFELDRFVVSPGFPIICGVFKFIFGAYWNTALILFQLILAAWAGLYVYKIGLLIFKRPAEALLGSLVYACFPLTLWFVHSFAQESLFQSWMIFFVYFLLKSLENLNFKDLCWAAFFFSLAYLTKSHILLFSVFVPLLFLHRLGFTLKMCSRVFVFASISLAASLPYGLYQLNKGNGYVLSSNGSGYQFYLGNTEAAYVSIVDVPDKGSPDYLKMKDINHTAGYFNRSQALYDSTLHLAQVPKQKAFMEQAFEWIKNNPTKFLELKLYDILFFFLPGVSYRHYSFNNYILSLFVSLPIYILAYYYIFRKIRTDFSKNAFILYLILSMLLFSTIWYTQNRFRTITVEPFYVLYAGAALYACLSKIEIGKKINNFITKIYKI
jgi:hypothetical protein